MGDLWKEKDDVLQVLPRVAERIRTSRRLLVPNFPNSDLRDQRFSMLLAAITRLAISLLPFDEGCVLSTSQRLENTGTST